MPPLNLTENHVRATKNFADRLARWASQGKTGYGPLHPKILNIRVGDEVQLTTKLQGKEDDYLKKGIVLSVVPSRQSLIVAGLNMRKRIVYTESETGSSVGKTILRESLIPLQYVKLVDPATGSGGESLFRKVRGFNEQGQPITNKNIRPRHSVRVFPSTGSVLFVPAIPNEAKQFNKEQEILGEKRGSRAERIPIKHEKAEYERKQRLQDKQRKDNIFTDTPKEIAEAVTYKVPDPNIYIQWMNGVKAAAKQAIDEGKEVDWVDPVTHGIYFTRLPIQHQFHKVFKSHREAMEAHAHVIKF